MANPPQGLFTFPGVTAAVSGNYTLSHGITPGVAVLELGEQKGPFDTKVGTLEFTFGGARIKLRDCRVDRASFRRDGRGNLWSFAVQDRRWRWVFGEISGHYNLRLPDGSIDEGTKKSTRELAALCLEAMTEEKTDLGSMPDGAYPEVHWEYANPAQALAAIADLVGCRVVLRLDDTVAVMRVGVGDRNALPEDARVMERITTDVLANRPDALKVVCGRTRYQADLELEPVGLDLDGSVRPIDELTYKPAGSWDAENPKIFSGVAAGEGRDLALATVYRWYRVKATEGLKVPGYPTTDKDTGPVGATVRDRKLLLAIEDVLVETKTVRGEQQAQPAEVRGRFWDGNWGYTNTDAGHVYADPFSIDREQGIVKFSNPVTLAIELGPSFYQFVRAELILRCAVSVRDSRTLAWGRLTRKMDLDGPKFDTGPRLLPHEEIVLNVWPEYSDNRPVRVRHNRKVILEECRYYLDQAQQEYQQSRPLERVYAGLLPISPDGAIQQVTWSVGPSGATTRASWNDEHSTTAPSYAERRAWERLRGGEGLGE